MKLNDVKHIIDDNIEEFTDVSIWVSINEKFIDVFCSCYSLWEFLSDSIDVPSSNIRYLVISSLESEVTNRK